MDITDLIEISEIINKELIFVNQLYNRLDLRTHLFASEYGITCPSGCGSCCQNYEPEISSAEANYAAAWIIKSNAGLSSLFKNISERKTCIFFNPQSPDHCMIYNARPLMCRAFGFSGVKDKYGNHKYKTCGLMEVKKNLTGSYIPIMAEEGITLLNNCTGMEETLPVSEAVDKAWQKLSFLILFSELDDNSGLHPRVTS